MIKKNFLLILLILCSSSCFATCNGVWEVSALVKQEKSFVLLSDKSIQYPVSAEFLRNLEQIHTKIDQAAGIFSRFLICNSDDPNAFAAKEGSQNISALTLGMIGLLGDDQDAYAAILGHEAAHLTQEHAPKKKSSGVIFGLIQLLAGTALEVAIQSRGGASGLGADMAALGTQAFSASYSRSHEFEADRVGLSYSVTAGYSADGVIRLHQKLNGSSNFLSTHPSSNERISQILELIKTMGFEKEARPNKDGTVENFKVVNTDEAAFGMVLTAKNRLGYYIGTQTSPEPPQLGMRVEVAFENGEKLHGTIKKIVNGYFSVLTDKKFISRIEGGAITRIR
jgi:hypothetical protein